MVQGGVKENVTAEHVELCGTIRNVGPAHRATLLAELERALDVGRALGAECRLEVSEGYPVTHNDSRITGAIRDAAIALLGPDRVVALPFDTWAEDFGYITATVPGAMFWLGVCRPDCPPPVWHSPTFDIDENALPIGAAVLAGAALRLIDITP